jgi:Ca-activated chloride channel family protein
MDPSTHHACHSIRLCLSIAFLIGPVSHGQEAAQQPPLTRMLFVMDASNSMNAFWGNQPKINTARELLLTALKELKDQPDLELALRLYGHQTPIQPGKQDCDDTNLEVPFSPNSIPDMERTLMSVRCVGTTPIARSLERAAKDFPPVTTKGARTVRNIIILITDGIEACDEDPCAVSRALQAQGIVLKPFVIGVGLDDAEKYALQCVGNYFDASTPELFEHVLKVVVTQALNSTTAQISLMTADGKPTETDVPVTLYDQRTGTGPLPPDAYHERPGHSGHLGHRPHHTYRVVAHTVPPSVREQVVVKPGCIPSSHWMRAWARWTCAWATGRPMGTRWPASYAARTNPTPSSPNTWAPASAIVWAPMTWKCSPCRGLMIPDVRRSNKDR